MKLDFDITQINTSEEQTESKWLKEGNYAGFLQTVEEKEHPNGILLTYVFEAREGGISKCTGWLTHKNEAAQSMGRKTLARIASACGLSKITDTQQMVGKPVAFAVRLGDVAKDGKRYHEVVAYAPKVELLPTYASDVPSPVTAYAKVNKMDDIPF